MATDDSTALVFAICSLFVRILCVKSNADARIMHTDRQSITEPSARTRDKVSNGRILPPTVDLRSATGRRFRYLLETYTRELGGDLGEAEQAQARQAVALQLEEKRMQAAIARGEDVDRDMLVRISSEARRARAALKAKALRQKPPAPTVHDLLDEIAEDSEAQA
jgi:hypothetical protein